MKKLAFSLVTLSALFATSLSVSAGTFSINSDLADTTIATGSPDGPIPPTVGSLSDYAGRVGEFFSPGVSIAVLPFQLPTLAAGEVFTNATLQLQLFSLDNGNGGLANVDLYGLAARATPTVLASDFYAGATPDLNPNATLLQADFLTPASTVRTDPNNGPFTTTSAQGDLSLAAFLNAQYALSGPGSYVFLRLSYDQNPSIAGNNSYQILTSDAGGTFEKPLLTLTTGEAIPEPSSTALMLLGGTGGLIALLRRRRVT